MDPHEAGWRIGRSTVDQRGGGRGSELWVPYDRTGGVLGPQGSGKSLDLLMPTLLNAPGGALVTLTKPEDLFLTIGARRRRGPVAVLDPFGQAPGVEELVWDPVAGTGDSLLAEKRAKAFAAGKAGGHSSSERDSAAQFYAAEAAKVAQAYFHAAALAGLGVDQIMEWVSMPRESAQPLEILRSAPAAASLWAGLLQETLFGSDERRTSNTVATVQQTFGLFFQDRIRTRCSPTPGRPATDLADLIRRGGTVYLLGREDPYTSASPLMTAVAEDVLDTALQLATTSRYGRLCPPFLACLDELPSTAPLPSLPTRMANDRALGISYMWAAQTWRQLAVCYGEDTARTILGLTNNLIVFGGGKDIGFYKEISDLIGTTHVTRSSLSRSGWSKWSTSWQTEEVPILRPDEIRRIPGRHALVISEHAAPIVAGLDRCIDGRAGRRLLAEQAAARTRSRAAGRGHDKGQVGDGRTETTSETAHRLGLDDNTPARLR